MSEPSSRIRAVHNAEGGIVMDIDHGRLFSLNATGSAVYELLAKGLEEEAIAEELTRRFHIPIETAKSDLHDFQKALNVHALQPGRDTASRNNQ